MTKEQILSKASEFEDEDEFVKCDKLSYFEEAWLCNKLAQIGLTCCYTGKGYLIEKIKGDNW